MDRRGVAGQTDDGALVERLRAGDDAAFAELVRRHHAQLLRLARTFVPSAAVAEEVVQDTWLGVVRGIDRFEERSSLKTWLFRILVNRARSAGVREPRHAPIATGDERAVDPSRFTSAGEWATPPAAWADDVDDRLVAADLATTLWSHLDELPDAQRAVLVLRDVDGLTTAEVCDLLDISEGNQRVLLHRARSRARRILEREVGKV